MKKGSNLSREFNISSFGGWEYAAPSEGFATTPEQQDIEIGSLFDRIGNEYGKFVSPVDEPFEKRSLPRGTERTEYSVYRVLKKITVLKGVAAPAFNMPGGAIQYKLPQSVNDLVETGFIEKVEHLKKYQSTANKALERNAE